MTGMAAQSVVDALTALARQQVGPGFAVAGFSPTEDLPPLWPGEAEAIEKAIEKRRREFLAGRASARAAMAELGVPAASILAASDRAPIWPDTVVGSISHTGPVAMALVARAGAAQSVGLDVEDAAPLQGDLMRLILTPSERARIAGLTEAAQTALGKATFVAKEAAYKAQYPLTRKVFGFQSMEIVFEDNGFTAQRCDVAGAPMMTGRIGTMRGFTLATVTL